MRYFEIILDLTWMLCSQYQWLGLCRYCFCKLLKAEKETFCYNTEKNWNGAVFSISTSTLFEY